MNPPPGVLYSLQEGKSGRLDPVRSNGSDLSFNVSLTLAGQLDSGGYPVEERDQRLPV